MLSEDVSLPVKSRIHAFEALASKPIAVNANANKSAPSLLDAPVSPSSKSYFPINPSTPSSSTKSESRSPSPNGPRLGRKTSLIDDWVLEDGPLPYAPRQRRPTVTKPPVNGLSRHVSDSMVRQSTANSPPLIHFEASPPNSQKTAPPLPPRKASYSSLKSVSLSNSSTSSLARSPNTPAAPLPIPPLPQRKKSDSLTVDHAYPPLSKLGINIPSRGNGSGHVPASSISSFHSVSLSSDGGTDLMTPGSITEFVATYPMDREPENNREQDNASLDESFENVSSYSVISPSASSVSNDWAEFVRRPSPPKLPKRPTPGPSTPSPATISVTYAVRNGQPKPSPPPPPPSRSRAPPSNRSSLTSTTASSDRSSVMSQPTPRSSTSSYRPSIATKTAVTSTPQLTTRSTPVPPAAKRRYEAVFVSNILAQRRAVAGTRDRALSPPMGRKARQAAGWRGLSVDLITNPQENESVEAVDEEVGPGEKLSGLVVAAIWKSSKLERAKLRDIWKECDPSGQGGLNREAFARGMWRIDEELRKARRAAHSPSGVRPPRGLASLLR